MLPQMSYFNIFTETIESCSTYRKKRNKNECLLKHFVFESHFMSLAAEPYFIQDLNASISIAINNETFQQTRNSVLLCFVLVNI